MFASRNHPMKATGSLLVVFCVLVFSGLVGVGWADEQAISSASALMDKGLFRDSVKVLEKAIERQGEGAASPVEMRMLAESYYMLKEYGTARTYFARALPFQTTPKAKIVCESRLAMLDYWLGDFKGAEERIENFIRKYPNDERVGTLAVVKIRIVQRSNVTRAEKIRRIEAEYQAIAADKERFGFYNAVLAAQTLGDLYVEAGNEQKAVSLYVTAVYEMRGLITTMQQAGRRIAPDLLQGVDGMSLQVAKYYLGRKDWVEAQKWLENVTYVDEMTALAKYFLAQIAFQKREFGQVLFLLQDEVVARIKDAETKAGMHLLIGFSWRDSRMPDLERAKEYLKKVPKESTAYLQAQQGLGDIYREQKDTERAETHYIEAIKDARFAPAALFYLGQIYKDRAEALKPKNDEEKKQREGLLKKAGDHLEELMTKYPLTDMAKQAKPLVAALQGQGVSIATEGSDEDRIAAWEKTIRESPGSNEAAQAYMSLAQHHSRAVYDPKTKAVIKAPNWEACSTACLAIVQSPQPFANVSGERWRELRARALYLLARSELGSLPPGTTAKRQRVRIEPVRMAAGGNTGRALSYLSEAASLTDEGKQPEFRREIEYCIIEAMLKSEDAAVRDQGEKRYADQETKYGNDPNYHRLAIITADWQDDHGQYEVAARAYHSIARKANLEREDVMQLLHQAGLSYGKAGRAMIDKRGSASSLAIVIQPRMAIRTATTNVILKTHAAFQFTKRILWDPQGPDITAQDALVRVSREFGVPFVWSPDESGGSVAAYLKTKVIPRTTLKEWRQQRTLERYLDDILGLTRFNVDFDLGASGGTPTFVVKVAPDEVEKEESRVIEIFEPNRERFAALAKPYGDFASVHRGPAMLFNVLKRIEEQTGVRIVWGDGVQKDEALSREFREIPGVAAGQSVTCREALQLVLETVGLRFQTVRRDRSREMIQASNESFDELRRFGADSVYAEDAMFNIAVNLYIIKEYAKMKLILREYLKTYDGPSFVHYYDACFWLGRLFEIERNFREAVKYYTMASDEQVVIYRPGTNAVIPTLADIKQRLSYETLFNISRKASGSFKDAKFEGGFLSFIRFHTNVGIVLDPSARGIDIPINRESFIGVSCIELLHDAMVALSLDLRTENGDKDVAEKSYYRLAVVFKEDNLMPEALENVNTLLARFPKGQRVVDALKLKLDIYKGLRDYANVLATLEQLRTAAAGRVEPFLLDYEMGRVYFDLCAYTNAQTYFARALTGTKDPDEWLRIREALAQTSMRIEGGLGDALSLYRNISQYETSPLRQSVNSMMIYYLEYATANPRERKPLPPQEEEFIKSFSNATAEQRAEMGPNEVARATWIYYALGMQDLVDTNIVDALKKLDAASASPDAFLSGEALYQMGMIHQSQKDFQQARDAFLQLLFVTKAVEPSVKATYELGCCYKSLGDNDGAFKRFEEVVRRYPISPYAAKVLEDPLYRARVPAAGTNAIPVVGTNAVTAVGATAAAANKAPAPAAVSVPAGEGAALMAISANGVPVSQIATNKESAVRK